MDQVPGGAVVAGIWATVEVIKAVVRKWKPRREFDLNERALLSADEKSFRSEVLTELRFTRGELARVNSELATCQRQHADGVTERIILAEKVGKLTRKLDQFRAAAAAAGFVLEPEI